MTLVPPLAAAQSCRSRYLSWILKEERRWLMMHQKETLTPWQNTKSVRSSHLSGWTKNVDASKGNIDTLSNLFEFLLSFFVRSSGIQSCGPLNIPAGVHARNIDILSVSLLRGSVNGSASISARVKFDNKSILFEFPLRPSFSKLHQRSLFGSCIL